MIMNTRTLYRGLALGVLALLSASTVVSADTAQVNPWPADLSPAGFYAAHMIGTVDDAQFEATVAPEVVDAARNFLAQSKAMGMSTNSGRLSVELSGANVRANNPAGDRIGETQSEISVCVYGDTVVVGWNDSRGFLAGSTLSSYAYSTDGAATFVDGGNVPLALASDQAFGDTDLDTDGKGNWYLVGIYTRTANNPDPTAEQNIAVWNGHFVAGVLVWNPPVQASIAPTTVSANDKCYLAVDRAVTGNVYVAYTRFSQVGANPNIEVARSTDRGATWGVPTILDSDATPTASKQCANPYCGPGGEVYVAWEKGANQINCPDGTGNLNSVSAVIAFSKSSDFGLTYSAYVQIGSPVTDFEAAGPGDLRERGNEFPDIVVDRSSCATRGNVYVTWHSSAPWTANVAAGPAHAEAADAANNNPGGAELFLVGENVTGTITTTSDLDYWTFDAVMGTSYLLVLDPQGFNCGVSGTSRSMRMRMYATQAAYTPATSFPDTLIAASAQGTFEDRITWTAPKTGRFLVRMQRSAGTAPFTYLLRVRALTFTTGPDGARDTRDVVLTRSTDGGATWSGANRINDDPAGLENRRPFMSVDDKGRLSVFWHDSRTPGFGSNAALTSVFGVTSRDGGLNWNPNYLVTDALSFFSFNTIAIPNLGDYNAASSFGNTTIGAWTDQRVTAGEVRDPVTGAFTAGPGPDAWTGKITFAQGVTCPASPASVVGGGTVPLTFCITNNGTVADQYNYVLAEPNGWLVGAANGTTGVLTPGATQCVTFTFAPPSSCSPAVADPITFTSTPVGSSACDQVACSVDLICEPVVPTLIADFEAQDNGGGEVTVNWSTRVSSSIQGFHLYRGVNAQSAFDRVNSSLIPVNVSGAYSIIDDAAPAGLAWYRLAAVQGDGTEVTVASISVSVSGLPTAYSFHLAGANPFPRLSGTSFAYALPTSGHVRVGVYNVAGQLVKTLVSADQAAGFYTLPLSFSNQGRALNSGIYLVKFDAGAFQKTVRVIAVQ